VYLFAALSDEQLRRVLQTTRERRFKAAQRLFHQNDPCNTFFLLRHGQVKLFRLSPDGYEKVIDVIRPGQTFAEAVMFMERKEYPVTADAIETSEVLCFDSQSFVELLKTSNDTCLRLMATMSKRLHWQVNEIDRLTLHNATFRLVSYLLEVSDHSAAEIKLEVPKHVLASRLSIQPETFSRILSRLSQKGLIKVDRHEIQLCDIGGLRQYLEPAS